MKSENSRAISKHLAEETSDVRYLRFFEFFNQQLFYEAHEVLEALWLPQRHGPDGAFYKGLIQLAGAFVHFRKGRMNPALALLSLARANLEKYGGLHHQLNIPATLTFIDEWRGKIETTSPGSPRNDQNPWLSLSPG